MRVLIIDIPVDPFPFSSFIFTPILILHTRLLTLALRSHLWLIPLYPYLLFISLVALLVHNVLKLLQGREYELVPLVPLTFRSVFDLFCLRWFVDLLKMEDFWKPKKDVLLGFGDDAPVEEKLGAVMWGFVPEPFKRLKMLLQRPCERIQNTRSKISKLWEKAPVLAILSGKSLWNGVLDTTSTYITDCIKAEQPHLEVMVICKLFQVLIVVWRRTQTVRLVIGLWELCKLLMKTIGNWVKLLWQWLTKRFAQTSKPISMPELIPESKPVKPWNPKELRNWINDTLPASTETRASITKLPEPGKLINKDPVTEWFPKYALERRNSCSINVVCLQKMNMWMTGTISVEDENITSGRMHYDSESDVPAPKRRRRRFDLDGETRGLSFQLKGLELLTRPRREKPWEQPGWIEPLFAPEVEMQDAPPRLPTPEADQRDEIAPCIHAERRNFQRSRLMCAHPLERSGVVYENGTGRVRPCTEQEEIDALYCLGQSNHPVPKEEKRWVKVGDIHTKESLKCISTPKPKRWWPWFKQVPPKSDEPKPKRLPGFAERKSDDTLVPAWEADSPGLM